MVVIVGKRNRTLQAVSVALLGVPLLGCLSTTPTADRLGGAVHSAVKQGISTEEWQPNAAHRHIPLGDSLGKATAASYLGFALSEGLSEVDRRGLRVPSSAEALDDLRLLPLVTALGTDPTVRVRFASASDGIKSNTYATFWNLPAPQIRLIDAQGEPVGPTAFIQLTGRESTFSKPAAIPTPPAELLAVIDALPEQQASAVDLWPDVASGYIDRAQSLDAVRAHVARLAFGSTLMAYVRGFGSIPTDANSYMHQLGIRPNDVELRDPRARFGETETGLRILIDRKRNRVAYVLKPAIGAVAVIAWQLVMTPAQGKVEQKLLPPEVTAAGTESDWEPFLCAVWLPEENQNYEAADTSSMLH